MPSDAEATMAWWPSNSDQPLDFSKKTRLHVYPPPPPPPSQHSPIQKFHHHRTNPDHPPTSTESTPLTMGFFRPGQHSPPPAPQIPLNLHHFNFMDPMLSMNDSFRPAGLLGGLPQLPFSFLDNRRPATKTMRPFKAYPRDPLTLPLGYCGLSAPVVPMDLQQGLLLNDDAYADFRKSVLLASSGASGMRDREEKERESSPKPRDGSEDGKRVDVEDDSAAASSLSPDSSPQSSSASCVVSGSGISSKRKPRTLPDELKDDAYWERRRKNNEAAKRSRDARRAKEDEIAIRAAYLEQENLRLKVELATMKTETNRLRCLLYNS